MNTKKVLVWGVVAVLLVLGLVFPRSHPVVQQAVDTVVGGTGQNWSFHQYFDEGLTSGGYVATTTGAISTYTTSLKDFAKTPSYISWNPSLAQTVTITATSTFNYVPKVGDVATVHIKNATSTAGTITWAAGSGLTLTKSEDDSANTTAYTATARFTLIRTGNYSVTAIQENIN